MSVEASRPNLRASVCVIVPAVSGPSETFMRFQSTLKCSSLLHFRVDFRAMDLTELLKQPEGKTLEFRRDLSSSDGALRTIVAFANTSGGTLLVGVEDRTRHV